MIYLILIALVSLANATEQVISADYQKVLEDINSKLNEISAEQACPGVSLAQTCGDGVCDPSKGENESTCPEDCLPVLVKSYNGQTFCKKIRELYEPRSISEAQEIVRNAIKENFHIRAIGKAHTVNTQLCTDGVEISTVLGDN